MFQLKGLHLMKQLFLLIPVIVLMNSSEIQAKWPTKKCQSIMAETDQIDAAIIDTPRLRELEHESKKLQTRGIVLTVTSPVVIGAGLFGFTYGGVQVALFANPFIFGTIAIVGIGAMVGGFYMLGQGIHDLAKSKRLRRMRMKEEALERKRLREQALLESQAAV